MWRTGLVGPEGNIARDGTPTRYFISTSPLRQGASKSEWSAGSTPNYLDSRAPYQRSFPRQETANHAEPADPQGIGSLGFQPIPQLRFKEMTALNGR